MVDVAFLLLTFFVLTATMADDVVMELTMPPKIDNPQDQEDLYKKIREDKIMTIVLDSADKVKYYVGITEPEIKTTTFDNEGVRKAIFEHLNFGKQNGLPLCKDVDNQGINEGRCWDPIFVLKPKNSSRYSNLVDLLDEMAITEAPKYAIDKFSPEDSLVIALGEERAAAKAAAGTN
ncbi:MAG: biopolymer transporter ExbD [Bacteroidia bacterium]